VSDETADRRAEALQFRGAASALSVRSAQALQLRLLSGATRAECAAFFGISQKSFDVMFLRGARELRARFEPGAVSDPPSSYSEEIKQAEQLAASFDSEDALHGELGAVLSLLRRLRTVAGEIRAQNAAALLEEQTSPRLRRRALLWRALVLVIVALALFFYLRPRPPPHIVGRVPQEELR
jgi:hypothetical protein